MFKNELQDFKKKVENEMKSFFNMTPEEVREKIVAMKEEYGKFCDLDKDTFNGMFSPEYKQILMEYKTLCYFDGIYERLLDIEEFFEEGL